MTEKEKYCKAQEKWIKDNHIKPGSKVFVMRKAKYGEKGWNATWNSKYMDELVGKIMKVFLFVDLDSYGLRLLTKDQKHQWSLPYFVLKPINPLKKLPKSDQKIEMNRYCDCLKARMSILKPIKTSNMKTKKTAPKEVRSRRIEFTLKGKKLEFAEKKAKSMKITINELAKSLVSY
jgi:hypothetical protein